jgi:hypothetical protein
MSSAPSATTAVTVTLQAPHESGIPLVATIQTEWDAPPSNAFVADSPPPLQSSGISSVHLRL